MKIHPISDLHREFHEYTPADIYPDVAVLAGDIGVGSAGVHWADETFQDCNVIYVPGNHEFYHYCLEDMSEALARAARSTHGHVHVLQNDEVRIAGTWFIGATLWTDFELKGAGMKYHATLACQDAMNDFNLIKTRRGRPGRKRRKFATGDAISEHKKSLAFIKERLRVHAEHGERCVVVTHHAPSTGSIAPRYAGEWLTCAYASNLDDYLLTISKPVLWVHGHTHETFDYTVGNTRVVCNARGFPGDSSGRDRAFDPERVVCL